MAGDFISKKDVAAAAVSLALASSQLKRTADYTQRGRQYSKITNDQLQEHFEMAFRDWVNGDNAAQRSTTDDLTAEADLRKYDLSFQNVKAELEALIARAAAAARDPEAVDRIGGPIIDEYFDSMTKPKN
jgi:hypothetical protein